MLSYTNQIDYIARHAQTKIPRHSPRRHRTFDIHPDWGDRGIAIVTANIREHSRHKFVSRTGPECRLRASAVAGHAAPSPTRPARAIPAAP